MVKAVLCDIDGTLVQSNWLHAESWQVAFAAMDLHLELEQLRRQIGMGSDELIPVFVPWWKREIVEQPLKVFRKYVFQHGFRQKVEPIPGVRDLLLRMKAAGLQVALASSSERDDLQALKALANIEDLVDIETCCEDTQRAKPYPDIFEAALRKLNLKCSECIALGDTPFDAESAGLAGVRTIGVTTGGWSKSDLLAAGCVEVYDGAADLLANFERSALALAGLHQ